MEKYLHDILNQLKNVISQLHDDDYALKINYLSEASIGKHVRHIVNFFESLLNHSENTINYDNRNRNSEIENQTGSAIEIIDLILSRSGNLCTEKKLTLKIELDETEYSVETSLPRELIYALQHCIHHMAIIKIALKQSFGYVQIPDDFGISYSTRKFTQTE